MEKEEKKKWLEEHWPEIEMFTRKQCEEFGAVSLTMLDETQRKAKIESFIADTLEEQKKQWMLKDSACKENVCGIDIHDYLEEIRNCNDGEKAIYLVIDDHKIIDKIVVNGSISQVGNDAIPAKTLTEYYKQGKKLYCCHNHPCQISAIPSTGDILSLAHRVPNYFFVRGSNGSISRAPEKIEAYKQEHPYEFEDWAVVTACDYYSYQQLGDVSERLLDTLEEKRRKPY